jgi:hypothetical protein
VITVAEVKARVAEIRALAGDDESAHSSEDALWAEVLQAIADGAPNAKELAKAALKTSEIDFARWCA